MFFSNLYRQKLQRINKASQQLTSSGIHKQSISKAFKNVSKSDVFKNRVNGVINNSITHAKKMRPPAGVIKQDNGQGFFTAGMVTFIIIDLLLFIIGLVIIFMCAKSRKWPVWLIAVLIILMLTPLSFIIIIILLVIFFTQNCGASESSSYYF